MSFTVTNNAGSLGDWLSLTPMLAARPGTIVIAKDSPHTREFAQLYDGLATVSFTNEHVDPIKETDEPVCFSQRILNAYGIKGSPIPTVMLKVEEIEWARNLLRPYISPVVFNNTTASARATESINALCNYRRMPDALALSIIHGLNAYGHTVIRFGCKTSQQHVYGGNYDELAEVVNIPDLTLRQLASCYAVIGRYVGTATGDMHLMLSVGGIADVFVPKSIWHYDHSRHHYLGDAWGKQIPRVRYHEFTL